MKLETLLAFVVMALLTVVGYCGYLCHLIDELVEDINIYEYRLNEAEERLEKLSNTPMLVIEEPREVAVAASESDLEGVSEASTESLGYFDVPLSEEVQDHIEFMCGMCGVDPAVVVAMIQKESQFKTDVVGDSGRAFGLMQIQPRWHEQRMKDLRSEDLLNPIHNVTVGIDYLSELLDKGKGLEWALMAYNGGPSYANKLSAEGRVSEYARQVMKNKDRLTRL